jgi:hypothetical protein
MKRPTTSTRRWRVSTTSRARMRAQAVSGFDEGAQRYEELLARMVSGPH